MTTIQATVQNGFIVPREPLDWPNGAEVEVTLRQPEEDDIFGESPEAIARWVALAESIPAPIISDEEWEAMQQRRRKEREWELANAEAREKALLAAMP